MLLSFALLLKSGIFYLFWLQFVLCVSTYHYLQTIQAIIIVLFFVYCACFLGTTQIVKNLPSNLSSLTLTLLLTYAFILIFFYTILFLSIFFTFLFSLSLFYLSVYFDAYLSWTWIFESDLQMYYFQLE